MVSMVSVFEVIIYGLLFKEKQKKDKLYLSIVNSYYDSERKQTVHSTYESFGTGQALIDQGISDPIAYLEDKVRTLNYEARQKVALEISDTAPYKYAGHFGTMSRFRTT